MMQNKEHTKTLVRFLQPAHDNLGEKLDWYHRWHKNPHHRKIHYLILVASFAGVLVALFSTNYLYPTEMAYAPEIKVAYDYNNNNVNSIAYNPSRLLNGEMQLFDIKLTLDNPILNKSSNLSAQVRFESFGNVSTSVDLTYRIIDSLGQEFYSEKGNVTVETEQLITKEFKNLDLKPGNYSLILTTVYGNNISDNFKQDFEVKESFISKNKELIGLFIVFFSFMILILHHIYRKLKKI